jgi:hypothetical protein
MAAVLRSTGAGVASSTATPTRANTPRAEELRVRVPQDHVQPIRRRQIALQYLPPRVRVRPEPTRRSPPRLEHVEPLQRRAKERLNRPRVLHGERLRAVALHARAGTCPSSRGRAEPLCDALRPRALRRLRHEGGAAAPRRGDHRRRAARAGALRRESERRGSCSRRGPDRHPPPRVAGRAARGRERRRPLRRDGSRDDPRRLLAVSAKLTRRREVAAATWPPGGRHPWTVARGRLAQQSRRRHGRHVRARLFLGRRTRGSARALSRQGPRGLRAASPGRDGALPHHRGALARVP